jgi:hypothetical protein
MDSWMFQNSVVQKKYIYATMSSWHQQTLIHLKITCTCMLKRSEVVPENKINGTVWNIHVSIHKLYVNDLPKNIFATICLWTVAMLFLKQRHCFGTFMNPFISFICYMHVHVIYKWMRVCWCHDDIVAYIYFFCIYLQCILL